MSGVQSWVRGTRHAYLADQVKSDGRESYLRAVVGWEDGRPVARLTGHQGSGNLFSLVRANALLFVPAGTRSMEPGDQITYWPL